VIDLHIHSTASDGSLSPEEIVAIAAQKGLTAIAIADHDSVEGAATLMGLKLPIELIPAVEASCDLDGRDIHMLAYFPDLEDKVFSDFMVRLREGRVERAKEIFARLSAVGVDIPEAEEFLRGSTKRSIGRGLIGRLLVEAGVVSDMREAFSRYLSKGRPGYVRRSMMSPANIVEIIRNAGAVPVVAHPGVTGLGLDELAALAKRGVLGVEVLHPEHTPEQVEKYSRIAGELGLVQTGGSDCHGTDSREGMSIGSLEVPDSWLEDLRALSGKRKNGEPNG